MIRHYANQISAAVYQQLLFKSCLREEQKKIVSQKYNSNSVGLNDQTFIKTNLL
jgi:hypothetical protein